MFAVGTLKFWWITSKRLALLRKGLILRQEFVFNFCLGQSTRYSLATGLLFSARESFASFRNADHVVSSLHHQFLVPSLPPPLRQAFHYFRLQ